MRVSLSTLARSNISEIRAYYGVRSPVALNRLLKKIEATATHLQEFPNIGKLNKYNSCRLLVVPGTHYLLPYRRLGENELEILAIFDTRQERPDAWQ